MEKTQNNEKLHMFRSIAGALKWSFKILKKYRFRMMLLIFFVICQRLFELYMTTKVGSIVDLALEDNVKTLVTSML